MATNNHAALHVVASSALVHAALIVAVLRTRSMSEAPPSSDVQEIEMLEVALDRIEPMFDSNDLIHSQGTGESSLSRSPPPKPAHPRPLNYSPSPGAAREKPSNKLIEETDERPVDPVLAGEVEGVDKAPTEANGFYDANGSGSEGDASGLPEPDLSRPVVAPNLDLVLQRNYPRNAIGRCGRSALLVKIEPSGTVSRTSVLSEAWSGLGHACDVTVRSGKWGAALDTRGVPVASEIIYTCRFVRDR